MNMGDGVVVEFGGIKVFICLVMEIKMVVDLYWK